MLGIGLISLILYIFVMIVGISFVFLVYKVINKSTLENDKIDKFIDYLKWVLITLSIPTIAIVISNFYQERREAIEEMAYFEKYTEDIKNLESVNKRLQLVRYFATVAPNKRIKQSWENYLDTIYKDYNESILLEKQVKILNLSPKKNSEKIDSIKKEISRIEAPMIPSKNIIDAEKYENLGFQFLIDKNVNSAISSFKKSEENYNSFHQVYEISRFLEKNKAQLQSSQSPFWKNAYQKIATEYSWKMDNKIKQKLIEASSK